MDGRASARGHGFCDQRARGGGRGRGGQRWIKRGWESTDPDLKKFVFEEGTAKKAGQYTKSTKEIIEWIRKSDKKEAEAIATELEEETMQVINAPPQPVGPEDPNNPGHFLPADAVELQIHA